MLRSQPLVPSTSPSPLAPASSAVAPWIVLIATDGPGCVEVPMKRAYRLRPPGPDQRAAESVIEAGGSLERTLVVVSRRRALRRGDTAGVPFDNVISEPTDRGAGLALALPLLELCRRREGDARVVVVPWEPERRRPGRLRRTLARSLDSDDGQPGAVSIVAEAGAEVAACGQVRTFLGLYKDRMYATLVRLVRSYWIDLDLPLVYPSLPAVDLFRDLLGGADRRLSRVDLPRSRYAPERSRRAFAGDGAAIC